MNDGLKESETVETETSAINESFKESETVETETSEIHEIVKDSENDYVDPYPGMQKHGLLFKLNGKENSMYIDPLGNHCSSCGRKRSQET